MTLTVESSNPVDHENEAIRLLSVAAAPYSDQGSIAAATRALAHATLALSLRQRPAMDGS